MRQILTRSTDSPLEGTEYLRDITSKHGFSFVDTYPWIKLTDRKVVYTEMIFWITITASLGIITACLPTVQALLRKLPLDYLRRSFSLRSSLRKDSSSHKWFRFHSNSTESALPHSQSQPNSFQLEASRFQLQALTLSERSKSSR